MKVASCAMGDRAVCVEDAPHLLRGPGVDGSGERAYV